jgi:DNA-binding MarR family transcriptional regulator
MKIHTDDDKIERIRKEWRQELPDLDTSPMETLGRILRAQFVAAAAMRRVFRAYDLDFGTFDVLATLRRSGPPYRLTPTQLYRELALTSGAMTNRMDALERAGLIERKADPADRRGMLAELTRSGQALVEKALKAHLQLEAELTSHLSKSEQTQLAQLLKKLLLGMETDHDTDE